MNPNNFCFGLDKVSPGQRILQGDEFGAVYNYLTVEFQLCQGKKECASPNEMREFLYRKIKVNVGYFNTLL